MRSASPRSTSSRRSPSRKPSIHAAPAGPPPERTRALVPPPATLVILEAHALSLHLPVAPRAVRRAGDGEVLDRQARRVEQRHRLRAGAARGVAREHGAQIGDLLP